MMSILNEYKKIIIMSLTLLIIVIAVVIILTTDIDFKVFENLSVASISDKKVVVDTLIKDEKVVKEHHETTLDTLEAAKNQYEVAKQAFENIDESTVDMVLEATKDEKYFIEYLWIVLGNYAIENDLAINIITPGSTSVSTESNKTQDNEDSEEETTESAPQVDVSVTDNAIKLIVKGRYANVADFVYEVENDKELKFKLDNIKMTYASDNAIEATFNILSLKVKK